MRIEMTDHRARLYERTREATNERAKSKSIDKACQYYVTMAGTDTSIGTLDKLLNAAEKKGSLTAVEIADILDCPQLPVSAEVHHEIGPDK